MVVNYVDMLRKLKSPDGDEVLDALSRLGAQRGTPPPAEVITAALPFITDPDPDLRQEAVFALGLHWTLPEAADAIVELLMVERVDAVLEVCVRAVGSYADLLGADGSMFQRALAAVAVDEEQTDDIRRLARVTLFRTTEG